MPTGGGGEAQQGAAADQAELAGHESAAALGRVSECLRQTRGLRETAQAYLEVQKVHSGAAAAKRAAVALRDCLVLLSFNECGRVTKSAEFLQ